jgi:hypothetical protein
MQDNKRLKALGYRLKGKPYSLQPVAFSLVWLTAESW